MSSESVGHDEAIGQFCGVTGASEERAKGLLEACDWNLELAINMHVETDDERRPTTSTSSGLTSVPDIATRSGRPTHARSNSPNIMMGSSIQPFQARSSETSRQPSNIISIDDDEVRPPIPPVRQVLVDSPIPTSSYGASGSSFNSRSNNTVYDAFRDFQAEAHWLEMNRDGDPSATESTTAANKRRTLEELFRPPLDLMFRGSLISAREVGQHRNKWLLVNVQNVREFACQILNRDVWSNQTVKDIIKEHFVFWQVYHDSGEGSKYIQFYNVTDFPYVAIVDPRTGEQLKSWSTSIDHNTFCDSVIEFLTEHPSPDGSGDASSMKKLRLKEDESSTLYDQSEEAQLEAAIKASLQDAESSNSLNQNADYDDCEIETLDSDTETSRSSLDMLSRSKLNQPENLSLNNGQLTSTGPNSSPEFTGVGKPRRQTARRPKETDDYTKYLGKDSKNLSNLVLRFPDGTRDIIKFPADSPLKVSFTIIRLIVIPYVCEPDSYNISIFFTLCRHYFDF